MKVLSIVLLLLCSVIPASAGKKYSYFRVGNANNVSVSTTPGTVLMGGGTDVAFLPRVMAASRGTPTTPR